MQSYPLSLPYLRLTIDGTDRTDELIAKTLRVHQVLGAQVDTCNFQLKAMEAFRGTPGNKPTQGQEVSVEQRTGSTGAWVKLFGGEIQRISENRLAYKTVSWQVACVDHTQRLQRVLVNDTYIDMTVSDVVRDVVQRYAPFVSTSGIQPASLKLSTAWTFARQYPADVIQRLAELVGYEWWVSPDSVLYFVDPNSLSQVSTNSLDDTSGNFRDLSVQPQLDQVRNRVYAYSDNVLTDEIVDEQRGDGDKRLFQLRYSRVTADLSRFMTVNGVARQVILAGVADESNYDGDNGFVLDAARGTVTNFKNTAAVDDTDKILFRYRAVIPGGVMREDRDSQATVAALTGTDYANVVLADNPLYYYRLNETTGTAAANSGTAGVSASGMWTSRRELVAGPLAGDQGVASTTYGLGYLRGSRDTVMPSGSYTLEAWAKHNFPVQFFGDGGENGIIGSWTNTLLRGAALVMSTNLVLGPFYGVFHGNTLTLSGLPSGGSFDHVVATYDLPQRRLQLWVNKQLITGRDDLGAPGTLGVSGIQIGHNRYNDTGASTLPFGGALAEVAVYNTALSSARIAAHHDAGVLGGVRERVLVDNEIQALEQLQQAAEKELARYSSVLTDVTFTSFVPDWQVGTRVPITVTAAGTGRDFSASPLIQQVEINSMGAQRLQYRISAVETRYAMTDLYKQLARLRQVSTAAPITKVNEFETTVVLVGAVPQVTTI